jgi:subfamily B ATP-binding cassette protein MsbA
MSRHEKSVPLTDAQRNAFRRIARLALRHWVRLALAVFFGIVFGGSIVGILASARSGLGNTLGAASGDLSRKLEGMVQSTYTGQLDHAWLVTALILSLLVLFVALRGIGFFFSKYLIEWIAQKTTTDLRNDTFESILHLPMKEFTSTRTGELISRTISDTTLVERGLVDVACDLIQQPFVLLFAACYLLKTNWRLAAVTLIVFPVCILPVRIFGRHVRRNAKKGQERIADLASIQQETVVGAAIVKAFGTEDRELARFKKCSADFFRRQVRIVAAKSAINPLMELITSVAAAAVLVYAKLTALPFDALIVFLGAMVIMYAPIKALSRVHLSIQQCAAAAERIFQIVDTRDPIRDTPDAKELPGVDAVSFEGVGFSYVPGKPVLRDVTLSARPGELIALVGSSGSGKTSLINLLPRFYDATEGVVRISGEPVARWTIASLREHIGFVTQETVLFNDTVRANIAYGKPDATDEEVVAAAKKAHAHEFILAMEKGYDTVIAERGILLSGGQRQRLAIARALLRDPPILLLDEATSALDTESERAVQAAINEAMVGRTVFAIAHRLSTIMRANQILVLENGRITERGTHEELLAKGGTYHRLYNLQFQETQA